MSDHRADPVDLTPKLLRAARALLAWSHDDLAKAAGVPLSVLTEFGRWHRSLTAEHRDAVRQALAAAGIEIQPDGAVCGPSISDLAGAASAGMPMRWVTPQDLATWASGPGGAARFPQLLGHLVRASHGLAVHLRFPSDDGVWHGGWDGFTSIEVGGLYVPSGAAVWEIGTQASGIASKATEDYRKRTDTPTVDRDGVRSAFVFVTPHHWPGKAKWVRERQQEGKWREVRVYDATDLVHWIELTPAVGLWLARQLNKRPHDALELEQLWEEWAGATETLLTEDLVLCDRDLDVATVLRWLRDRPSVLDLRATTAEEVVAFFHASLAELPDDVQRAYRARCLVALSGDAARALLDAQAPPVLVLTHPDPGLARSLQKRGHYVLQAHDEWSEGASAARTLARPTRDGITWVLMDAGFSHHQADTLARDSARNLAVLRRLLPPVLGRRPTWADHSPRALLAALLACGWSEESEADRSCLADLANAPYDAVMQDLAPCVGGLDAPLQQVGSTWRMASPRDAWALLAPRLIKADLERFEAVAHAVLSAPDPRFDMAPNERWLAPIREVQPRYSGMLRRGIGQMLVSLAVWGSQVRTVPDAGTRPEAIVRKLLHGADQRRWWSLSTDFQLLAEAAPVAFLDAVEESLDQINPPIAVVFGRDEGGLGGTEYVSGLMWALEILAWSPDRLSRVSHILARLDELDTKPRRLINGPANSLKTIYLLALPYTNAPLAQRLKILAKINERHPDAAWKLILGILPHGTTTTSSPTAKPRWQDISGEDTEEATDELYVYGATQISALLVDVVGPRVDRWVQLLDRISDLWPDPALALDALDAAEPRIIDGAERLALWNHLRQVLHRHRRSHQAEWALPEPFLARLDLVYDRLTPTDPLDRVAWLFQRDVHLPRPDVDAESDWDADQSKTDRARSDAILQVHADGGSSAVRALARRAGVAAYVGTAFNEAGLPATEFDALLEASVRSDHESERLVGRGLIFSMHRERGQGWALALVAQARAQGWGDDALGVILGALPVERWVWEQAAHLDEKTKQTFWHQASRFWRNEDPEEIAHAIRSAMDAGCARQALAIAGHLDEISLPSELLVEVLGAAVRQPFDEESRRDPLSLFRQGLGVFFDALDRCGDVSLDVVATLEWRFLQFLERSREPNALIKKMAQQPAFFVQLLTAVYMPTPESGVLDPEPADPDREQLVVDQGLQLFDAWNRIPGTRDDGTIDGDVLEAWITQARALAKAVGREGVADSRIGTVLSASPMGDDGHWPAEAVRGAIERFHVSESLVAGFEIGKHNRRGVTTRNPSAGGAMERCEAGKYRTWAKAMEDDYPHTAKVLAGLANSYDREASRNDESAMRRDWAG